MYLEFYNNAYTLNYYLTPIGVLIFVYKENKIFRIIGFSNLEMT